MVNLHPVLNRLQSDRHLGQHAEGLLLRCGMGTHGILTATDQGEKPRNCSMQKGTRNGWLGCGNLPGYVTGC